MKRLLFTMIAILTTMTAAGDKSLNVYPFGSGGQFKMTYDRRQRPQALWVGNRIFLVYNGGAPADAEKMVPTFPFITSFDLETKAFTKPIQLSEKADKDQHHCPIIWADRAGFLHILFGCHRTPGVHLVSKKKGSIGTSVKDWSVAAEVRVSISYPTAYNVANDRQVIYLRTGEHRSSWSYRLTADSGKTWSGPKTDVVDLNIGGDSPKPQKTPMKDERSSYQTCLPSRDGKSLHVVFAWYDDNKQKDPEKFWNPRYKTNKNLGLKYNLYYVNINLQTGAVKDFAGKPVETPISFASTNRNCMIWDTDWRGAGVPPDIILDENDTPAFLHVLTEDTPEKLNYYYVRHVKDQWVQTPITASGHEWHSGHLRRDKDGALHAYLIAGRGSLGEGKAARMDRHGGGGIEEWISTDKGNTWKRVRDLTPKSKEFAGWKFNNIQPVKDAYGKPLDGAYLFYGWKDPGRCTAKAFLILE